MLSSLVESAKIHSFSDTKAQSGKVQKRGDVMLDIIDPDLVVAVIVSAADEGSIIQAESHLLIEIMLNLLQTTGPQ